MTQNICDIFGNEQNHKNMSPAVHMFIDPLRKYSNLVHPCPFVVLTFKNLNANTL